MGGRNLKMISKELLGEVLGETIKSFKTDSVNVRYQCIVEDGHDDTINIYELAHKCKEWAYNNGFVLTSSYITSELKNLKCPCGIMPKDERFETVHITNASTEQEAIFQACQWILDRQC